MTSTIDPTADLTGLTNDELTEAVCGQATQVAASTCRFVLLVAELDRREAWSAGGILSCAHWLNWRCGLSLGTAREHLRVGYAIEDLALVREAFANGTISYSKVRAITRVATPDNEEFLMRMANLMTASQLERVCQSYRTASDESDRLANAKWNEDVRTINSWTTTRGTVVIRAELPADEGAVVLAGLEATSRELRAERDREKEEAKAARQAAHDVPAETSSDVPSESSDDPAETSPDVPAGTPPDPRPYPTRADSLVAMAESALVQRPVHVEGPESTRVVIHIDERVLKDPTSEGCCHIEGVGVVPLALAERLTCDASMRTVRYTQNGVELSSPTRDVPERMRRALRLRDGGCRFPGCITRGRVHAHHVQWWTNGGPTRMDNLCLLCSYHHHAVHEGGYQLEMTPVGDVTVKDPWGFVVPEVPDPVVPSGPVPAASDMPYWGESFRTSDVVDGLWGLDHRPEPPDDPSVN